MMGWGIGWEKREFNVTRTGLQSNSPISSSSNFPESSHLGSHRGLLSPSLPLPYPFLLLPLCPPLRLILTCLLIVPFVACRGIPYLSLLIGLSPLLHLSHSIICHLSHTSILQGPCQWTLRGTPPTPPLFCGQLWVEDSPGCLVVYQGGAEL